MQTLLVRLAAMLTGMVVAAVAIAVQFLILDSFYRRPLPVDFRHFVTEGIEIAPMALLFLLGYGGIPAFAACILTLRQRLRLRPCALSGILVVAITGFLMNVFWFTAANRPPPVWLGLAFFVPGALGGAAFYLAANELNAWLEADA